MNFFECQDRARTNTKKLVFVFGLCVLSIITIVNLMVMLVLSTPKHKNITYNFHDFINQFDPKLFLIIGLPVLFVLTIVGLSKKRELSIGGKAIAQQLDGRLISANTTDPKERQLLNVVEEVAIASGVVNPPVFVINELGINAFAAGFDINDAVIGITRGAIDHLNRDELQGVIAHEFSHIFNSDMRLNITLISLLHSIMFIGSSGYYILRSVGGSRSKSDGNILVLLIGLGLLIIGYVGTFFGNLIKAFINKQREYLADASAVQFTRNNLGIASALKKIGGLYEGSKISNPQAAEISHMFFASGVSSLFATHPPLSARILMLDPSWDGEFISSENNKAVATNSSATNNSPWNFYNQTSNKKGVDYNDSSHPNIESGHEKKRMSFAPMAHNMIQNIGNIDKESIAQAHDLISSIPEDIKNATSNPFSARAVIYSLIMVEGAFYQKQLQILQTDPDQEVFKLTNKLYPEVNKMDKKLRLTIIELSASSLKQLSSAQYQSFKKNIKLLISIDSKVDLFEWSLVKILFNALDRGFSKEFIEKKSHYNLQAIKNEASLFLSLMSHTASDNEEEARQDFKSATINQNLIGFSFVSKNEITIQALNNAILKLEELNPLEKQRLLNACAGCMGEQEASFLEAGLLLRAFSATLKCPIPLHHPN